MRITVLVVLANFLLTSYCYCQKNCQWFTNDHLEGQVINPLSEIISVEESRYNLTEQFGKPIKGDLERFESFSIDLNGCLTKSRKRISTERNYFHEYKYSNDGVKLVVEVNVTDYLNNLIGRIVHVYGIQDNPIEETEYNPDGSVLKKTIKTYDNEGEFLELRRYGINGILKYRSFSTIESSGRINHAYNYDENGMKFLVSFSKYDNADNLIEQKYFDEEGKINEQSAIAFEYDESNNRVLALYISGEKKRMEYNSQRQLVKEIWIDVNGDTSSTKIFKYDEAGNEIETIEARGKSFRLFVEDESEWAGSKLARELKEYNSAGKLLKHTQLNPLFAFGASKRIYIYDGKGNQISITSYNAAGDIINWSTNRYDEFGNLVEHMYSSISDESDNKKNEYLYTYDSKGNWIEKMEYKTEGIDLRKAIQVETRKIEYRN